MTDQSLFAPATLIYYKDKKPLTRLGQDVFAILIAAHHPTLRLLGISTSHGNAHLADTTDNTSRVLTAIGRTDICVYPGTAHPFCRGEVFTPEIHGMFMDGISSSKHPLNWLASNSIQAQPVSMEQNTCRLHQRQLSGISVLLSRREMLS